MIKLHNSLTRQLEDFKPAYEQQVAMYVCGPTVYGPAHIGNARPAMVFDQLFRVLRYYYGPANVGYVRNITDIDDKIIAAAIERDVPIGRITDTAIAAYHADLDDLHCLSPTIEPRATQFTNHMVSMITKLIEKKFAYVVDGEVFFSVAKNPHAGLANHTDSHSGERVAIDPRKPRDFVLWKPAKPGEPSWFSPWGHGRPGWHIECSAMIDATFARPTIDIHGGGQDLRFPHHEAECAQSACYHDGQPLANYWLHNGLLTVEGEKMSKSRGNVIVLNELFDKVPGESVRFYFLSSHYRSPMDFSIDNLMASHRALSGIYDILYQYDDINYSEEPKVDPEFMALLCNDLNTPQAISYLHNLATQLNTQPDKTVHKGRLLAAGQMLGLFNQTPHQWRTFGVDKVAVEALIEARLAARQQKDYQAADVIRQQLADMGITLADGAHGTSWRKS
jgi:cysteinyl-tRNA synthetase